MYSKFDFENKCFTFCILVQVFLAKKLGFFLLFSYSDRVWSLLNQEIGFLVHEINTNKISYRLDKLGVSK